VTTAPNPYQSPAATDEHDSWWSRLRRFFTVPVPDPPSDFAAGGKMILDGIAFYIDPNDPTRFYAASPSEIDSDERLDLVASETVRLFPRFLRSHSELYELVHGRVLTVRLITTYADGPTEYSRERDLNLDWDYVSSFLEETTSKE